MGQIYYSLNTCLGILNDNENFLRYLNENNKKKSIKAKGLKIKRCLTQNKLQSP